MADTRTLKLALLADVQKFLGGMSDADGSAKGLSSNIGKYSKAMAKSFALAGVAAAGFAVKLGVDSVKAAAEDEKSSRLLQIQLEKTVGANQGLVDNVEKYISATQKRVGVQDDALRPSLARLVRSTEDTAKAQQLLNLALDISVATGKPLETVANALGKAYDGNAASLGRLGLGLDASILKSNDFDVIGKELTRTFGGFADKEAKTLEGQLRIVGIVFDELKEDIGTKLLPVFGRLLQNIILVSKGFSGEDPEGLSNRARELAGNFEGNGANSLGGALRAVTDAFAGLFSTVTEDGDSTTNILVSIAGALETIANAINTASDAYQKALPFFRFLENPLNLNLPNIGLTPRTTTKSRAAGGSVMGGQAYRVGEFGPEMFVPAGSGSIRPADGGGGNTVININGVIDAESARRSIEKLLQNSARRTGPINLIGATL